ncbi:MAG: hypothetical protein ACM3VT_11015 [Solirubrobacterales bacterium]
MAPEQLIQTRTALINTDPMMKELSTRIVQMELDLPPVDQAQSPEEPADPQKEAALRTLQKKFEERRLALAKEFDSGLEDTLKEAARQRVAQAKAEKAQIEAYIEGIGRALGNQEIKVVNTGPDARDIKNKLAADEEMLNQVDRRLRRLEMELDRRFRVQIASFAEVRGVVDGRLRWTLIVLTVTIVGTVLLIIRRPTIPEPAVSNITQAD